MPQGRIIKPDFWSDSKMVQLSPFARLLYIGMWNFALCDKGHHADDSMDLKLKILPADPVDPDALLAELVDAGRVVREAGVTGTFLSIPKMPNHQKADDPRWAKKCPICRENHDRTQQSTTNHDRPRPTTPEHSVEGKGVERNRSGVSSSTTTATPYCPKHPAGTDSPCGPCRTARLAFEASQVAAQNAPTPPTTMVKPRDCGHANGFNEHGYCARCGEREPK